MTGDQERTIDIAIVGATGLVGGAVLELLEQRDFPVGNLYPLASGDGAGAPIDFCKRKFTVHELDKFDFAKAQIAIFCVPMEVAKEFVPVATEAGCIVIDHSAAFRNDPSVPLVLADVNPDEIADFESQNIITCPDSTAAHIVLAVMPLLGELDVDRITAHAMCAVSSAGRAGIDELSKQSIAMFNLKEIKAEIFPKQIAFNVLPRSNFDHDSDSRMEERAQKEIDEIIRSPDILVGVSTSLTPVFFGHSYRLRVEFKEEIDVKRVEQLFAGVENIELDLARSAKDFTTVVTDAAQDERLFVDQIRVTGDKSNFLDFWLVADNIRCGVARNSVQIAEILVKDYL